mgnify:FL=1
MTFTNLKYINDKDNNKVSIMFTVNGQEMSVATNSVGNRHYDEILKQVEAGTLTIADAD